MLSDGKTGQTRAVEGGRWVRLALCGILLLALALRVYRLAGQSLWYDEAVTAQVAGQGIAELTRWTADDIQPPLYYYVVAGWTHLAGRGEWALRFPSLFFGTLTVALLAALARRLFRVGAGAQVGVVTVALLAAVSPFYVYYAQEARMYALLTFLAALAGYALLRAFAAQPRSSLGWWLLFTAASAAMLYTHYFGAFLLLALGLCVLLVWLFRLPRTGAKSLPAGLRPAILSAAGIVLLYLPWLPAMLNRYQQDRSYWQGSLKLGEALRHVAVGFTAGAPETMLETVAVPLLPWFGLALALALAGLLMPAREPRVPADVSRLSARWAAACLLLVLAVPTVAVLALASRTPKFNPRYLMLVSPAYFLLLGGGIAALLQRAWPPVAAAAWSVTLRTRLLGGVGLAALSFVAVVSAWGLHNWFTDSTFLKAQWRELAAAVRREIGPDEAVLLVSGHASPAWDYYAPDIPRTRLPDIDILDVDAVLGFQDGAQIGRALAGKSGAWVVFWQADAVDPVGFVPYFLDGAGQELPKTHAFWHLELRHWRLRPDASYAAGPQPAHADGANYQHQVALLGWDGPQDGQLTLYWRALNTIARDYQLSLVFETRDGQEVPGGRWDGRPSAYRYPTFRWQPGKAVFGRYPLPKDLPAGDYYVTVAVYDEQSPSGLDVMDVADNPAGKRVRLGPFHAGPAQ